MWTQKLNLPKQNKSLTYYSLNEYENHTGVNVDDYPYALRIMLENLLRAVGRGIAKKSQLDVFAKWLENGGKYDAEELPYMPARVLLQDLTGVPAMVDLALLRAAMSDLNGDPSLINPTVRSDMVVDHSVQVDYFGDENALAKNIEIEYKRNRERYKFLKWAQASFSNLRIVPPGLGIVHQVNLEFLSDVISRDGDSLAFPDTCVGTDSHTTMSNGAGVLSWGVGGIEAEAVMLGQPYFMALPEVVGVKLRGELPAMCTATDLVLAITRLLREVKVVGKIVEFFGEGLNNLPVTDRATIGNMSPEYGATAGFFPIDHNVIDYLRLTGRSEAQLELVDEYARANRMRHDDKRAPRYTETLDFELDSVEPSVAGPRRPQDLVKLTDVKRNFSAHFPAKSVGAKTAAEPPHGGVAIAAITSCTNTSNPSVMLGAGLLARNASAKGLARRAWVKSSLAPGSRVVSEYLERSGLYKHLEEFGFNTVGYGCTTCIGNSGPLTKVAEDAIGAGRDLVALLSGNRNFEGRIHPLIKASYLASPMLVVAYAIAGRIDIDFESEPIGASKSGKPVFLKDVWPSRAEIDKFIAAAISPEIFTKHYSQVYDGTPEWQALEADAQQVYNWENDSTYIKKPTFFDGFGKRPKPLKDILGARALVKAGDSVTTDHISPAGAIPPASPTASYLRENGVKAAQFNSYGSRRGNHEVMARGTFGNVRFRNLLLDDVEGDWTMYWPDNQKERIFEAAQKYIAAGVNLIILAGKDYGMGSSRDWAAKGPRLLGVSAVIAESYERIHRSNLIGMGILPLQYRDGENAEILGLVGNEKYHIRGISDDLKPRSHVKVEAANKTKREFTVQVRLDNKTEVDYYLNDGILPYVLRQILNSS